MLVAYCRLCRHCCNLAEGGCLLSRFHFTRCRHILGHVACRNLPWQGLIGSHEETCCNNIIKSRLFVTLAAGVAGEDMLDEFLVGKRELDHGQSATMDVRRFVKTKEELESLERKCYQILIRIDGIGAEKWLTNCSRIKRFIWISYHLTNWLIYLRIALFIGHLLGKLRLLWFLWFVYCSPDVNIILYWYKFVTLPK